MDAWESTAGFGSPFFVLTISGDGQVDRPRGLRRDAGSCRPGAAFPSAGHPVLIRARDIHGALVALPGRHAPAHPDVTIGILLQTRRLGTPTKFEHRLP